MLDALLSSSQVEELSDLEDAAASPVPGEGSSIQSLTDSDTDYSSAALIPGTVSGGDAGVGSPYTSGTMAEPYNYTDYLETLVTSSQTLVDQNVRLQVQNEACISLLLIIVIVGMLNYVYKFFKMFF